MEPEESNKEIVHDIDVDTHQVNIEEKSETKHEQVFEQPKTGVNESVNVNGKSKLACCIDIIRKLSPSKIEHNITGKTNILNFCKGITNLIYDDDDLLNSFLQSVDKPSEISKEDKLGEFLKNESHFESVKVGVFLEFLGACFFRDKSSFR